MITIRHNIFETNSSSSHSLVIKDILSEDIQINNKILNVSDLKNFIISSDGYNNYEFILCDTRNKKLALAFAIILNKLEYDEDNENTYFHDLFENLKNQYDINEVIGEYGNAWDEDEQLSEVIDIIDKNKIVQSKYECNG